MPWLAGGSALLCVTHSGMQADRLPNLEHCRCWDRVYWFPIAAVTSYHKLKCLKTMQIYCLPVMKVTVWNGSHWAKVKVSAGLSGRICFPPFPASGGCLCAFLHFHSQKWNTFNSLCCLCSIVTSSSALPLLPPSCEDPCDYSGPTWRSRDNLLISRSLITLARSFLSCEVTYSQVPGVKRTSLGGPLFSLPHRGKWWCPITRRLKYSTQKQSHFTFHWSIKSHGHT